MSTRFSSILLAGVLATCQFLFANVGFAHHPEIAGEAVCDTLTGQTVINYTATAWEGNVGDPTSRANPQIEIYLDGVLIGTGAFSDPDYAFSGSTPAPTDAVPGDIVTLMAKAAAPWGNGTAGGQSTSVQVEIPSQECAQPGIGRFTGGGHQIRVDGVRVTRGLTIHCDLLLSNNLEVNWQGNKFHMTEHLVTVACLDHPDIIQAPPAAPLDTLIGVGTGRYNNMDGFTIEFTLVDAGEPGVDDKMAILRYETAEPSNIMLDVPLQLLEGGNLQAHYDQPHK